MSLRADNSKSFLREPEFIAIADEHEELQEILRKDKNGNLVYSKRSIEERMNTRGFDKQLIFNALYLQNYTAEEIKKIIQELADYMRTTYGIRGFFEVHGNDTTQQSFHIHFHTNDDSPVIFELVKEYLLEKKLSSLVSIDIQGKFIPYSEMDSDEEREEAYMLENRVVPLSQQTVTKEVNTIEDKRKSIFDILRSHTEEMMKGHSIDTKVRGESISFNSSKQLLAEIDGMNNDDRLEVLQSALQNIKSRRNKR